MDTDTTVSLDLPLFSDLFAALPAEWRTGALRDRLLAAYRHELHCFVNVALRPDCREPRFVMRPWRQSGEEWRCDFWVADAALPRTDASAWPGHNTSQWRHGGTISVLRGQAITTYCPL